MEPVHGPDNHKMVASLDQLERRAVKPADGAGQNRCDGAGAGIDPLAGLGVIPEGEPLRKIALRRRQDIHREVVGACKN
jgi:hypothetical protein